MERMEEECSGEIEDVDEFEIHHSVFSQLRQAANENMAYFEPRRGQTDEQLYGVFTNLFTALESAELVCVRLLDSAKKFDCPDVPANGFRSLLKLVQACISQLIHEVTYCSKNRDKTFFFSGSNVDQLSAYVKTLKGLTRVVMLASKLLESLDDGYLFPESDVVTQKLQEEAENLNRECFYGQCLGFQYAPSIKPIVQSIAVAMAAFGEGFLRHSIGEDTLSQSLRVAASSVWHGTQFVLNSERRAKRIVSLTGSRDIRLTKAFWSLTEGSIMQNMSRLVLPSTMVNALLSLPADIIHLRRMTSSSAGASSTSEMCTGGEDCGDHCVAIAPLLLQSGKAANITVRLVSAVHREGQPKTSSYSQESSPPARGLIIHFHGGGFVAQTSKSHQPYLRSWSRELDVPVLSVDYSLAPEHPFPRGVCDCLYAYAWALKNAAFLGTTAERVVLAGDSAGGNLAVSVALAAAELGIRRPDGVMAAYAPFLIANKASPSRLMGLMDLLLPQGILLACLDAYSGQLSEPRSLHLSPQQPEVVQPRTLSPEAVGKGNDSAPVHWQSDKNVDIQWSENDEEHLDEFVQLSFDDANRAASSSVSSVHRLVLSQKQQDMFDSPDSPFLSPLKAGDKLLKNLPRCDFIACALDPLLDDSVAFAKCLKQLQHPVQLFVVDSLPHGFLNLTLTSAEATRAYDICTQCMREALAITPVPGIEAVSFDGQPEGEPYGGVCEDSSAKDDLDGFEVVPLDVCEKDTETSSCDAVDAGTSEAYGDDQSAAGQV